MHDPNAQINKRLWDEFTKSLNNYPVLTWKFNKPSNKVDFMDLTISIHNGKITMSLLENLSISTYISHLTLPIHPDSSQASSTVPYSKFLLYVPTQMIKSYEQGFFKRLQARGYKSDQIIPLFLKTIAREKSYSGPSNTKNNDHTAVIFHLPFHP